MSRKSLIVCPHCGKEYLPAEIYFPKAFFGDPFDIIRDEKGEILGFNGSDMNLSEEYQCDSCDKTFIVEATIAFKTSPKIDIFADDEYTTDILKAQEKTEKLVHESLED